MDSSEWRQGDILRVVDPHPNHLPLGRYVRLVVVEGNAVGTDAVSELFKASRFEFVMRPNDEWTWPPPEDWQEYDAWGNLTKNALAGIIPPNL